MNKLLIVASAIVLLIPFKVDAPLFTGKILYKNSFVDFRGNDITDKFAPSYGRELHYYINDKNYKALDEQKNWVQLYNSDANVYYHFNKDKTARKIDGSTQTGQKFIVTKLEERATIAGYDCKALRVEEDDGITIYYYSPSIKTDPKTYSKHNLGDWNKYLEATDGALPLKFISTDHKNGYIWTSVATQVTKMNLTAKDFEFPRDFKIKQ